MAATKQATVGVVMAGDLRPGLAGLDVLNALKEVRADKPFMDAVVCHAAALDVDDAAMERVVKEGLKAVQRCADLLNTLQSSCLRLRRPCLREHTSHLYVRDSDRLW